MERFYAMEMADVFTVLLIWPVITCSKIQNRTYQVQTQSVIQAGMTKQIIIPGL